MSLFAAPVTLLPTGNSFREGNLCEDTEACYNGGAPFTSRDASETEGCVYSVSRGKQREGRNGAAAMILDPNDFLKMALIVIVVVVLIVIVLPFLSGRGRR